MKKNYINPIVNVIRIETIKMLAESSRGLYNDETAGTTGAGANKEYNSLGREFDFEEE